MHRKLKDTLWHLRRRILETYWRAVGGQRHVAFGQHYNFTPQTIFPSHPHMRLPRGNARPQLVRFGDFVQMHAICRYLEKTTEAPTIVEVGAFQGAYAVIMGRLAQRLGGQVLAIEPDPGSFAQLVSNVRRNGLEGTVQCEQVAVLDQEGFVDLETQESQTKALPSQQRTSVRCQSLTQILHRYKVERVDVLLVDVEGAELPVLRGLPWGELPVERIFCELHPYAWPKFGYDGADWAEFLQQHQLRCLDMYLAEHSDFSDSSYLGPTLLLPESRRGSQSSAPRHLAMHQQ